MAERVERRFDFRLAAELLRSRSVRDALERELGELMGRWRESAVCVSGLTRTLEECAQRERLERDHLRAALGSGASTSEWLGRARFLDELRADERRLGEQLEQLRGEERLARHKCELVRRDLDAAQARVRALERIEESGRREHAKALARQDERKLEELTVERWTHPSTNAS